MLPSLEEGETTVRCFVCQLVPPAASTTWGCRGRLQAEGLHLDYPASGAARNRSVASGARLVPTDQRQMSTLSGPLLSGVSEWFLCEALEAATVTKTQGCRGCGSGGTFAGLETWAACQRCGSRPCRSEPLRLTMRPALVGWSHPTNRGVLSIPRRCVQVHRPARVPTAGSHPAGSS